MMNITFQPRAAHLLRYPIASADMYYSVVNERDVYVFDDPIYGLHIWGEIPGLGEKTAVNLCEVLLEYAMSCSGMGDDFQAVQRMEAFGDRLGESLAKYIKSVSPLETKRSLGECSLEYLLESMDANFLVEQHGDESRYILKQCPLRTAALRAGLPYEELAQVGINKLCKRLLYLMDPLLEVYTPVDFNAEHIFTLIKEHAHHLETT